MSANESANATAMQSPPLSALLDMRSLTSPFTLINLFVMFLPGAAHLPLFLATLKSKQLRSTCNLLIGFEAFLHATFFEVYWYAGEVFVANTWETAAFLHCEIALGIFFFLMQVVQMFPVVVAIERFLLVFFPLWSQDRNNVAFAIVMTLPVVGYALSLTVNTVMYILTDHHNIQVPACMMEIYMPSMRYSQYSIPCCMAGCWIIYAAIWLRIRIRSSASPSSVDTTTNQKLNRSLAVVLTMLTLGLILPNTIPSVMSFFGITIENYHMLQTEIVIIPTSFSFALTPLALYLTSSQYRETMDDVFLNWNICKLIRRMKTGKQTSPTPPKLFKRLPNPFVPANGSKHSGQGTFSVLETTQMAQ